MSDEQGAAGVDESAPNTAAEREITFRDRVIWVRLPSPEQILVWQRIVRQLQSPDIRGWDSDEVMRALDRARRIIDSIILHRIDVEWLDDLMLDGDLTLEGAAEILQLTIEAFGDGRESSGNRADRRAAKNAKPKKATRRKA